jgi:hypothetical protein
VVLEDGDEDKSHKKERPKIVWDDAAVSRLLDRSELGTSNLDVVEGEPENDWLGSLKVGSLLTLVTKRIRRVAYFLCLHSG